MTILGLGPSLSPFSAPPITAAPRAITSWTPGPWAGCHTADELEERCRLLTRRWWEEGGWLTYLYYRALAPTWPPGALTTTRRIAQ